MNEGSYAMLKIQEQLARLIVVPQVSLNNHLKDTLGGFPVF